MTATDEPDRSVVAPSRPLRLLVIADPELAVAANQLAGGLRSRFSEQRVMLLEPVSAVDDRAQLMFTGLIRGYGATIILLRPHARRVQRGGGCDAYLPLLMLAGSQAPGRVLPVIVIDDGSRAEHEPKFEGVRSAVVVRSASIEADAAVVADAIRATTLPSQPGMPSEPEWFVCQACGQRQIATDFCTACGAFRWNTADTDADGASPATTTSTSIPPRPPIRPQPEYAPDPLPVEPPHELQRQPPPPVESARGGRARKRKAAPRKAARATTIDEIVRAAVAESIAPGLLTFNSPEEMRQGVAERVEVRVGRGADLQAELTDGLRGRGIPTVEPVRTSPFMGVELTGKGFEVTALSAAEQLVAPMASWQFDVLPRKSGHRTLTLLVGPGAVRRLHA